MEFRSTEDALQFLSERVSDLSARTYYLENSRFAQSAALAAILSFLSEIPSFSMEMISDVFNAEAERMEANGSGDPDLAERFSAIATEIRSIGTLGAVRPLLAVRKGGREDQGSED